MRVTLDLSGAEALVLYEWLAAKGDALPVDPAERIVLDGVEGLLERVLVEPFKPDYKKLVEMAKAELLAQGPTES
jgi:hypothetical protein